MKLKKLLIISGILIGSIRMTYAQNQLVTYPAPREVV